MFREEDRPKWSPRRRGGDTAGNVKRHLSHGFFAPGLQQVKMFPCVGLEFEMFRAVKKKKRVVRPEAGRQVA